MSVPSGARGDGKLKVLVKANELATYTIRIAKNKNVFLPEYQSSLTDDIVRVAKDIFIDAWTANNIRVGDDPVKWKLRKELQEKAILNCNNLLALMEIAQSVFHLKTKRIKFWGAKTIEVRQLLRKWNQSDVKRYEKSDR